MELSYSQFAIGYYNQQRNDIIHVPFTALFLSPDGQIYEA
jgi:hypothetical protein